MKASEIRSHRLRTILQHAHKVKSYDELVDFAVTRFAVTRVTAMNYVDTVIKLLKARENKA